MRAAFAVILLAPLAAVADPPRYETRDKHDPNGTGKFYLNREIAQVMGHEGADWLDRPEREKEEQPAKLLKLLQPKAGLVVADIGAGSGYYSTRLAEAVGPTGKVLAEDIQPEMLAIVKRRAADKKLGNVEPVLGTITDPKLPAGAVDLALLVDVYHEFSHPFEMVEGIARGLKVGGKLVLVEYRLEDEDVPIKLVHKMSEKQAVLEMKPHALKHVKTHPELPWQHVMVFEKVKP